MKKLIYLLAFIPILLTGQSIDPVNVGTPDQGDGDNLRAAFVKVNSNESSLDVRSTNNATSILTLQDNTTGVAGWTISLNATSDSLVFTSGNNVYKVPIGDTQEDDITPPTVLSAEVGAVEDSIIYVTMSENVDSLVPSSAWGFLEGSTSFGVDTMDFFGDDTIRVYLDSAVASNSDLALSYTRPGTSGDIQDASANPLATFTGQAVTNNVACDQTSSAAFYRFENNANDENGTYNATATGGATYTSSSPLEGSYSGDVNGSNRYFAVPSIPYGNNFTINIWFRVFAGTDFRTLYTNMSSDDGFKVQYDFGNDRIFVVTGNGTSTQNSYSTSSLGYTSGTWEHVAVSFNKTGGVCAMYFDGVDVTSLGATRTDYATTGVARIGIDLDDGSDLFGDVDDCRVFLSSLNSTDIASLYANPGTPLTAGGCGDPPIPSGDVELLWENDWADYAIQSTLPIDTLQAHMPNFEAMASDGDDDVYDWVDIVDFNGKRWAKNWYYQNHCCTESVWEPNSNGGTGMDPRANISPTSQFYTEVYISYSIYLDAVTGDFVNSKGFKLPGVQPEVNTSLGVARMMILNWTYGERDPAYYTHAYWNGYDQAIKSSDSRIKTGENWIPTQTELVLTIRTSYGTAENHNGFMEFFVDGIFIGGQGLGSFRPGDGLYSIPFHPQNSPSGWGVVQMSTFMGGEGVEYQSPKDQFMLLGPVRVWKYSDTAEGVPRWDDANPRSGPERDISGALRTLGYDL
jgi:hypothetical protein